MDNNVEIMIENAILKSLAVQVLDLVMQSTDENLKIQVHEMIEKLKNTKGSDLKPEDFMGMRGSAAKFNLLNM